MSNMSYCRFHNTLLDLQECLDILNDTEPISNQEEKQKAKNLMVMITEFVSNNYLIDDDGNIDYTRMDCIVNECNENEEED